MTVQSKPIPAFYAVYILRSTVRHASLYIGSTPNPPRRLSQHNGLIPGGAARTSRGNLRPWEMVALVSGFPSATAALKFEWALNNPHISVHIPSSSRLAVSTQSKRGGRPRRPQKSVGSVVSNLHLLLRVPSFARWPLQVHFFERAVHAAWEKWCATAGEPVRDSLGVVVDFGRGEGGEKAGSSRGGGEVVAKEGEGLEPEPELEPEPWGIHALPLDYEPIKEYVAKGQEIFEFERQGNCVVCHEEMSTGEGLHALCSNGGCDGVGHLACWGRRFLQGSDRDGDGADVVPVQGQCPKCNEQVLWGDMMRELTLRTRGAKDVEKLLNRKRRRTTKKVAKG